MNPSPSSSRYGMSLHALSVWLRARRGASVVEYLVALILVALVVLGMVRLFGTTMYEKYKRGDERISEMDRGGLGEAGSSSGDGDLIRASSGNNGSAGGRSQRGAGVKGSRSLSQGTNSLATEKDGRRGAGGRSGFGASGESMAGGADGEQRRRGSADGRIIDEKTRHDHYALRGEKPPEEFRFNLFTLIILGLLLLFLGYMIIRGNKEGGSES